MMRLFGQQSFAEFEWDKLRLLAKVVKEVSDSRLLSNKDNIEVLTKAICKHYYMECDVELNFNEKKADVKVVPVKPGVGKRVVIYSVPVKGSVEYLRINPFNPNDSRQMGVEYSITNGHFQFAIDTHYYGDLDDKHASMALAVSMKVQDHINDGLATLKPLCNAFNAKIDREVTEMLNGMLPDALKRQKAIDKLNS